MLDRLHGGAGAPEALASVLAGDDEAAVRQVGVVDAAGVAAVHTGERCIAFAGHQAGAGSPPRPT